MDSKTKKIIRIIGLFISLFLLIYMGKLIYDYNIAVRDEIITPVKINIPSTENNYTQEQNEQTITPPVMRDENDMPKSDVKVPEIG